MSEWFCSEEYPFEWYLHSFHFLCAISNSGSLSQRKILFCFHSREKNEFSKHISELFLKWMIQKHQWLPAIIWVHLADSVGEGNGTPLQYSCLENPMDGGSW